MLPLQKFAYARITTNIFLVFLIVGQNCMMPFFPLYLKYLGLSAVEAGIVRGVQSWVGMVCVPVSLFLVRHMRNSQNKRACLVISLMVTAVTYVCLVFVPPVGIAYDVTHCAQAQYVPHKEFGVSSQDLTEAKEAVADTTPNVQDSRHFDQLHSTAVTISEVLNGFFTQESMQNDVRGTFSALPVTTKIPLFTAQAKSTPRQSLDNGQYDTNARQNDHFKSMQLNNSIAFKGLQYDSSASNETDDEAQQTWNSMSPYDISHEQHFSRDRQDVVVDDPLSNLYERPMHRENAPEYANNYNMEELGNSEEDPMSSFEINQGFPSEKRKGSDVLLQNKFSQMYAPPINQDFGQYDPQQYIYKSNTQDWNIPDNRVAGVYPDVDDARLPYNNDDDDDYFANHRQSNFYSMQRSKQHNIANDHRDPTVDAQSKIFGLRSNIQKRSRLLPSSVSKQLPGKPHNALKSGKAVLNSPLHFKEHRQKKMFKKSHLSKQDFNTYYTGRRLRVEVLPSDVENINEEMQNEFDNSQFRIERSLVDKNAESSNSNGQQNVDYDSISEQDMLRQLEHGSYLQRKQLVDGSGHQKVISQVVNTPHIFIFHTVLLIAGLSEAFGCIAEPVVGALWWHQLDDAEHTEKFGEHKLWGLAASALMCFILSFLVVNSPCFFNQGLHQITLHLFLFTFIIVVEIMIAFFIPLPSKTPWKAGKEKWGRKVMHELFGDVKAAMYSLTAVIGGAITACCSEFVLWHMDSLGGFGTNYEYLYGAYVTGIVLSQIPLLYMFMHRSRFQRNGMLGFGKSIPDCHQSIYLGMCALTLHLLLIPLITVAWGLVPLSLLRGLSAALLIRAGEGRRGFTLDYFVSSRGTLSGGWRFGYGIGCFVAGLFIDIFNATIMFWSAALGAVMWIVIFATSQRLFPPSRQAYTKVLLSEPLMDEEEVLCANSKLLHPDSESSDDHEEDWLEKALQEDNKKRYTK